MSVSNAIKLFKESTELGFRLFERRAKQELITKNINRQNRRFRKMLTLCNEPPDFGIDNPELTTFAEVAEIFDNELLKTITRRQLGFGDGDNLPLNTPNPSSLPIGYLIDSE